VKRVLVTGAAGYIGSHACKALARAGFEPVGLDNLSRAGIDQLAWGPLEIADVADSTAVASILERYRPCAAMHFAAYAYVGESMTEPALYYRNNVGGSLALLESLRNAAIRNFVFSSTCATYGVPRSTPIDESHTQAPINPYGMSKLMVERMLADFDRAHGLRYVALRYFNAAGADPDGELGECHEPETHAIPLAIAAAFGEREAFEIYGTDYPTEDGTAIRDYIHVSDLVDAHVRALEYLLAGKPSIALNLGTGRGHSVRQVLAAVEQATGRAVPARDAARRAGDPAALVADPRRAHAVLGWQSKCNDLVETVRSAVNWHRSSDAAAQRRSSIPSVPS
jgi:UDP-glucose-4-epimerase GalE